MSPQCLPMSSGDTIVALGTPVGESALAVIRVSGPECLNLVRQCFRKKKPPQPRQVTLGAYRDRAGRILDQGVFVFYEHGRSYTGEAMLEISLHGNPFIAQKVIEDLIERGCRPAEPGEFTRKAFLNGKLDLSQAEAVADVIRARSDRALAAAQRQLGGELRREMEQLADQLLQIIAGVEAYIDFPDEDLPPEDTEGPVREIEHLKRKLDSLIATSRYKQVLSEGIRTVLVGPPNAGKSSLLNALLGENRAIVSPEPGTTRDFISEKIIIGPYVLQIVDTAGLHESAHTLERLGMDKTLQKLEEADFFLVVVDGSLPSPTLPAKALSHFQSNSTLVVENKSDLGRDPSMDAFLPDCPHVRMSLLSGEGMEDFRGILLRTLEQDDVVPTSDRLILSARHAQALTRCRNALDEATRKIQAQEATELMASDLREALDAIGEVVGKMDNEQVLDKLFSSFCIGK